MRGPSVHFRLPPSVKALNSFENRTVFLVAVLSLSVSLAVINANGDMFAAAGILAAASVVFLSLYRLHWGFNILVGAVLIFDHQVASTSDPITYKVRYFWNIKDLPYLPSIPDAVLTVFEAHFLFLCFVWLLGLTIRRELHLRSVPLRVPSLFFLVWILISLALGLATGGNLLPALWETRALMYFGLFYFFVPQVIRTRQHLESLMWVVIGSISFKAMQGVINAVKYGFNFSGEAFLTASQEDAVFIVTMLLFLLAMGVFGAACTQRRALLLLLLPMFLGFLAGNRRATYVSLTISILAFVVLLSGRTQRMMIIRVASFLLLFGTYLAVFWNNYGVLGQPAQQVKSVIVDDPTLISATKYSSNLYRKFESYNLATTIRHSPILGLGFGKPYETPITLFLKFGLSEYVAHNSLLWLFMRTGAIGFGFFLFFINMYLFRSTSILIKLTDPYLKALCAVCILAVVNQVVVTYVEMHFTYYRNMTYLAVLMGLIPAIESCQREQNQAIPAAHRPPET